MRRMRPILLVMVLGAACSGSRADDDKGRDKAAAPATAPAVAPAAAGLGFSIIENGRPVIEPAADGSFTLDGPTKFVIASDGTLSKDGTTLVSWTGTSIKSPGGELAQATDAGLKFGGKGEVLVDADGKVTVKGGPPGGETFQVRGLNDANRRAAFTLLTWLFVGEEDLPATANAPADVAGCRAMIEHAARLGVMKGPDGTTGTPPPEALDEMAKQCAETGMTTEAVRCFTAAKDSADWAACDKKF